MQALAVPALVALATYAVAGRIAASLGDVGDRILPVALACALLTRARPAATAALAAVVVVGSLIGPYAANFWTPVQTAAAAAAALAVTAALVLRAADEDASPLASFALAAVAAVTVVLIYEAGSARLAAQEAAAAAALLVFPRSASVRAAFVAAHAALVLCATLYGGLSAPALLAAAVSTYGASIVRGVTKCTPDTRPSPG